MPQQNSAESFDAARKGRTTFGNLAFHHTKYFCSEDSFKHWQKKLGEIGVVDLNEDEDALK